MITGAVGLVDVGLGLGTPFEGCHGTVIGSCLGVSVGVGPVNFLIAAIVVV